jgi:hypothetical protein
MERGGGRKRARKRENTRARERPVAERRVLRADAIASAPPTASAMGVYPTISSTTSDTSNISFGLQIRGHLCPLTIKQKARTVRRTGRKF